MLHTAKPSLLRRAAIIAAAVASSGALMSFTAHAAVTERDILIKSPSASAAVYYLAQDGKRYVFPNEKTYKTWFKDFSAVTLVSANDLMAFPLGGNVTYRPGIKMVKIDTDPKVYAVSAGGELRWIKTEAVAAALYGSDWNTKIDDVPDAFFVNYRVGAEISAAADFSAQTQTSGTDTINEDKGIVVSANPLKANTVTLAVNASADSTAPSAITDLALSGATDDKIVLTWEATGDDATTGTATSYDIRYSTTAITEANFGAATAVTGEPTPTASGTTQTMSVTGLNANTTYYFAIKVSDDSSNASALSNVATQATLATQ